MSKLSKLGQRFAKDCASSLSKIATTLSREANSPQQNLAGYLTAMERQDLNEIAYKLELLAEKLEQRVKESK